MSVTKYPQLKATHTDVVNDHYRDVNVVRPNLFHPRPDIATSEMSYEHNKVVNDLGYKYCADATAANKKWTEDMRAMHQRTFSTINRERYGDVPLEIPVVVPGALHPAF